MDPEARKKAIIAVLLGEIDVIHRANELYWREANPSDAAKADYLPQTGSVRKNPERTC
jgi:hypothetical protein